MIRLKIDGSVIEYSSWVQAHDDLVRRYDCSCHCHACCEQDPVECVVSTLDQCHDGWSEL